MDRARTVLEKAIALAPNLARANYFYAKVLRADGNYEGAAARLRRVLAQYPRDRVALNDLGRILFLQRKYDEAVKVLQSVLAIDPEDLQAHYNLMLCYNGLGDEKLAKDHQARYLRFKADESSQAITGPYRQLHPEDNNERQAVHEHVSVPLPITTKHVGTAAFDRLRAGPRPSEPTVHQVICRGIQIMFSSVTRLSSDIARQRERQKSSFLRFLRASVTPWLIVVALALASEAQQVHFRDITAQAGIHFTHNNGAFGKKWLPETMGPGCAFIDYDNDGYPDILLVNGEDFAGSSARWRDHAEALSQQSRRHLHRRHAQGGTRGSDVRLRRCRGRLR